jgi:uncharacterized ion transporter superfamily protein YfcC
VNPFELAARITALGITVVLLAAAGVRDGADSFVTGVGLFVLGALVLGDRTPDDRDSAP